MKIPPRSASFLEEWDDRGGLDVEIECFLIEIVVYDETTNNPYKEVIDDDLSELRRNSQRGGQILFYLRAIGIGRPYPHNKRKILHKMRR